jgi:hypothetical protein
MYIGQVFSLVMGSISIIGALAASRSAISFVCGFDGNHDVRHRFETDWGKALGAIYNLSSGIYLLM